MVSEEQSQFLFVPSLLSLPLKGKESQVKV